MKRGRAGWWRGPGGRKGLARRGRGGAQGTGVGAAPRSRGLRSNGVGAVLPGCWRRGAGARVCQRGVPSRPADAWPPRQGERQSAGSPGTRLGRSWGRGVGLVREGRGPRGGKETCQGAAGGGVRSDQGAGCTREPGAVPPGPSFWSQAGATWKPVGGGGFEKWVSAAEGRDRVVSFADAGFGALGGGGWSSTGSFQLKGCEEGGRL